MFAVFMRRLLAEYGLASATEVAREKLEECLLCTAELKKKKLLWYATAF